jgi:hypothetical protein
MKPALMVVVLGLLLLSTVVSVQCDVLDHDRWVKVSVDSVSVDRWRGPPVSGSERVYDAPALFPQYAEEAVRGLRNDRKPRLGLGILLAITVIGGLEALSTIVERCA